MATIEEPQLTWTDGVPRSAAMDDIYFSVTDGLAETRHVFLGGIDAPEIWRRRRRFTIAELGFGTGLNFLATWALWRRTAPSDGRLHYVAVEGFPLSPADTRQALSAFPELADLSDALVEALPRRHPGYHRLHLDDGRVSLTIIYGQVAAALAHLGARVDAWYLDGFAPARNPDMWTDEVLALVGGASKAGARLATFTAAGAVRRGLHEAGFHVDKRRGFGAKRECLQARFAGDPAPDAAPPWFHAPEPLPPESRIAVVGAGIAGVSAAGALQRAGARVTVFEKARGPAAAASGTPAGLVQPRPLTDASPRARFFTAAYLHAVRTYDALDGAWLNRGLLVMGRDADDRTRYARLAERGALPTDMLELLDGDGLAKIAGTALPESAVWFPDAGLLDTQGVCRRLLADVESRFGEDVRPGRIPEGFDAVVWAAGLHAQELSRFAVLGLHANRGQLTRIAAPGLSGLRVPITFGGYVTPARDGIHTLGSTFSRIGDPSEDRWREPVAADDRQNVELMSARVSGADIETRGAETRGAWVGLRATTPDRLPVVGAVPDEAAYREAYAGLHHGRRAGTFAPATYRSGHFVMAGFGSHGFLTAPLAAEVLAAQMMGGPLPVDPDAARTLHPARFLIAELKRPPD